MTAINARPPWWTLVVGANPLIVVLWLLLAGYRAGQGQWLVAALDAIIGFLLFVVWRLHRFIDGHQNGSEVAP